MLGHPILANPATPTMPGVTDGMWAGNCQGPSCWHGAGVQAAEAAITILGDISMVSSLAGGIIRSAAVAAGRAEAIVAKGGTYLLREAETGAVVRTVDLARRAGEHARDPVLRRYCGTWSSR